MSHTLGLTGLQAPPCSLTAVGAWLVFAGVSLSLPRLFWGGLIQLCRSPTVLAHGPIGLCLARSIPQAATPNLVAHAPHTGVPGVVCERRERAAGVPGGPAGSGGAARPLDCAGRAQLGAHRGAGGAQQVGGGGWGAPEGAYAAKHLGSLSTALGCARPGHNLRQSSLPVGPVPSEAHCFTCSSPLEFLSPPPRGPPPSNPSPLPLPRRLLDDNRELYVPELQEVVRPHPHFMLFATQNPPGIYAGRKTLSRRAGGQDSGPAARCTHCLAATTGSLLRCAAAHWTALVMQRPAPVTTSPPPPVLLAGPSAPASWSCMWRTSPTRS